MEKGVELPPLPVVQHAPTLFGPLDRRFLAHIFEGHPTIQTARFKKSGWMYAKDLPPTLRKSLICRCISWFSRIKGAYRRKILALASSDEGWKELRRVLVSCEMRMNCIILSKPTIPYDEADRINSSLVSNTLNQKNFHKFLKSVIKKCRKAVLEGTDYQIPRSCTWLKSLVDELSDKVQSTLRQLTLLQTRAAGYPTEELRKESLEKWLETVTSQPDVDISALENLVELEEYVKTFFQVNAYTVKNTHVSLGAGSCLESPRREGGKTGLARRLIQEVRSTHMIDLETGELTCNLIFADKEPGEFLFHYSLAQAKTNMEEVLRVRTSGIDEVGMKYRNITVPSFFHSTILSPWSHLTYQFLETSQETKSGVAGTNHAWEMSKSLSASDPNLPWLFGSQEPKSAVCSDLEAATDSLFHTSIEALVDVTQAVMPVQTWYYKLVRELLSSPRNFTVKVGDNLVTGLSTRGVFMGDHGSKTLLTMSGIYALAGMNKDRVSRLVGDDHATVTVSQEAETCLKVYRERMESLGYVISEDDTFISDTVFFAEEAFDIPTDPTKTTEVWLGRKGKKRLPFHDVPKVKILSDVGKDMGLFSETAIGKITLMGKRMENTGATYVAGQFHLASWIQDICLGLLFRKEFVYFPRFLVQTGKPILFGTNENVRAFLRMHRLGRLQGSYAFIMESALPDSNVREHGRYIIQSFLTHGANDEQVRIIRKDLPAHDFEEDRVLTNAAVRGFEPFLVSRLNDYIISETEIVSKLAELEVLLGEKPETSRLTVETLARGDSVLTDWLLTEFINHWNSNSKLLRFSRTERYYIRENVEAKLGVIHPLRVDGILKPLPLEHRYQAKSTEHDREVKRLYEWVISNPQRLDDVPRTLIRDDLILLSGDYLTMEKLLVVSNDRKLVSACADLRSFNFRQRRETFHITVEQWILADLTAGDFCEPSEVFIDEGSLDGYLDNLGSRGLDPPDPDGSRARDHLKPVRPRGRIHIPIEVMELHRLRDLSTIEES